MLQTLISSINWIPHAFNLAYVQYIKLQDTISKHEVSICLLIFILSKWVFLKIFIHMPHLFV